MIEYESDDLQCNQITAGGDTSLRIRAGNRGRFGLNHVRARFECEGRHSHWLRLQHDNEFPFHRSVVEGEILPADESYWLYFDVAYFRKDHHLYIQYADEYLMQTSETVGPIVLPITIRVWAGREGDGYTALPAVEQFRLEIYEGPIGKLHRVRLVKAEDHSGLGQRLKKSRPTAP